LQKNLPKTRREAIALGLTRYFTGKPCKNGHVSERATSGGCILCRRDIKNRYIKTPEGATKRKEYKKRYKASPSGKAAERRRRDRQKETESGRAALRRRNQKKMRRRYALGLDKKSTWYNRTPKWADGKAIEEFIAAKPLGYHLDHIIPIRGDTVSGLHVLENLQYLPAEKNRSKSNSVIPITLEAVVCPIDTSVSPLEGHTAGF
jgi:hypothetical protein